VDNSCSAYGIGVVIFSEGLALEFEFVGLMDEAIEDRVGEGGVSQIVVPMFDWQLTGDDGRAGADTIIEQLKQIRTCALIERSQSPVVQNDDVRSRPLRQALAESAIAMGDTKRLDETRQSNILRAEALAACLVAQGTSEPRFAAAGLAGQDHILGGTNPVA
jgi:hypothetical protein